MLKTRLAAVAVAAVIATMLGGGAASASAALPIGGLAQFVNGELFAPKTVAGANDWGCKPSAAHPYPVVLVHGTLEDMGSNWVALAPMLKNQGYCVFALNFGQTALSLGDRVDGLGDIPRSAGQIAAFVDRVRNATGASKVDMVGHSQGGHVSDYYIKFDGGAAKVNVRVGLSPADHGSTVQGLSNLLSLMSANTLLAIASDFGAPALAEQTVGSSYLATLAAGGIAVAGPRYVNIETTNEDIVTPYTSSFFPGSNVQNILIQNACPTDKVGHVGLIFDGPALGYTLNALGANSPGYVPSCTNYGIPL